MTLQHELLEWLRNSQVGDLHSHSTFSMCCKEIKMQDLAAQGEIYRTPITLTDHSSHLLLGSEREIIYQTGIMPETLTALLKEHFQAGIQRYQSYIDHFRKLSLPFLRLGVELDALENGLLFFPPQLLKEMELFIGHVPHLFAQKKKESYHSIMMEWKCRTENFMAAGVDVLAHPFRVLCTKKIPFDVDTEVQWLVDKAASHLTALEINAHHQFPEVDEIMVKMAIPAGVRLAIATDSHHHREILDFSYHSMVLERCGVKGDQLGEVLFIGQSKRKIETTACWHDQSV